MSLIVTPSNSNVYLRALAQVARRLRDNQIAQIIAFGFIYGLAAKAGLNYSTVASNVTLLWPPSGLSLFAVLHFGYGLWPGIIIGDLIANAGTGAPIPAILCIATGNILETLICAELLRRVVGFRNAMQRVRDVLSLLVLGSVCAILSALIGPASLALAGTIAWPLYWKAALQWCMGDATGVIVFAPLLFAWATQQNEHWTRQRVTEAVALLACTVAASEAVFGGLGLIDAGYYPAALALFPLVVWGALRFGLRGAVTVTLLVSIAAVWGTAQGKGPFVVETGVESLMRWWLFVNVITITGLLLAASRSEHALAQGELERERDFVSAVLDTEGALVAVLNRHGNVIRVNRAFETLSGYRADELHGLTFADTFVTSDQRAKVDGNNEILRLGLSSNTRYDSELVRKNGERALISWSNVALRDSRGQMEHMIVTGVDISERFQATQALQRARRELEDRVNARTHELAAMNQELKSEITERQRLEHEIIRVSEHEQMRIGQELHDGLGQHLTATAFLAEVLERTLAERDVVQAQQAAQIERMLSDAVSQTRLLARGLFPVELESNGLMAALEQLTISAQRLFGVRTLFRCPEPVLVFDSDTAIHLYRIAQEALTNAVKHSEASAITVELARERDIVNLTISDDGVGLRPSNSDTQAGMGLRIMRYRAKLIGAQLDFLSPANQGLSVRISFTNIAEIDHDCNIKHDAVATH
jgi:PAS domain S-box-containing protein